MVDRGARALNIRRNLLVRLDAWSRRKLLTKHNTVQCFGSPQLSSALESLHGDIDVCGVGEPAWIDKGVCSRVVGLDGDGAARQWSNHPRVDCGVVLPQDSTGIAQAAYYVLDFWPVGCEGGEVVL